MQQSTNNGQIGPWEVLDAPRSGLQAASSEPAKWARSCPRGSLLPLFVVPPNRTPRCRHERNLQRRTGIKLTATKLSVGDRIAESSLQKYTENQIMSDFTPLRTFGFAHY